MKPEAGTERPALWALVLILVGSSLLYLPILGSEYSFDDRFLVQEVLDNGRPNTMVSEWDGIGRFFATPYWSMDRRPDRIYRPVTVLSFAAINLISGGGEAARVVQQGANILLHAVCVLVCWLLLGRIGVGGLLRSLATATFAFSAIHHEVVVQVVGRGELLGFAFGGLATWLLLGDPKPKVVLWAGFGMFLAFCSKESALAWAAFALICRWLQGDSGPARLAGEWKRWALVLGVPLLLFLLLRNYALRDVPGPYYAAYVANPLFSLDAFERILNAIFLWGVGLLHSVLPFWLCSDYGATVFDLVRSPFDPLFLASATALSAVLWMCLRRPRQRPQLFLAAAAFFGFGLVSSNLLFPVGVNYAERLFFSPSLGVALALAWGGKRVPIRYVQLSVLVWSAACAWTVLDRNPAWQDQQTLAKVDQERQPSSVRLGIIRVQAMGGAGDLEGASRLAEDLTRMAPEVPQVWQALGSVALRRRRPQEAVEAFERGLAAEQYRADRHGVKLFMDLSSARERSGDRKGALQAARDALVLSRGRPVLDRFLQFADLLPSDDFVALLQNPAAQRTAGAAWAQVVYFERTATPEQFEQYARGFVAVSQQAGIRGEGWRGVAALARALEKRGKRAEALVELRKMQAANDLPLDLVEEVRAAIRRLSQ